MGLRLQAGQAWAWSGVGQGGLGVPTPPAACPWTCLGLVPPCLQGSSRQPQPGLCSRTPTVPAGRREWLRFQEAEYKFFEHHSTWAQAQRICTWFQAELVSVHSQAELDFLGHNLQKVSTLGEPGPSGSGRAGPGRRGPANPYLPDGFPQLSPGQEQHWWIGLHTAESDGRFR